MNKVILIGRLGRDPDLSYTPEQGTARATFSLATNRRWTDRATGERREETTWFPIVAWGGPAETAAQYLHKGDLCCIDGRFTSRETDKGGVSHRIFEVVVERLELLGSQHSASQDDLAEEAADR